MSNDDYIASQRERLAFEKANSGRIVREACLNASLAFIKLVSERGCLKVELCAADYREAVMQTACFFEDWVNAVKEPVKDSKETED